MSFVDIRDQSVPVRLLRSAIARDRVPNGFLFWGPGGVGKRTTALELAKAVNCTGEGERPCDACLSCRKVVSRNHPDLQFAAPVKRSRTINVEAVEYINGMAALRPREGRWRVFIIQEADRMNEAAQNKFLKTLEEPPGRSLFILLSEFPNMLLPTIRSRCQMLRFGMLRPGTVVELLLRDHELEEEGARAIAGLAQGQMDRAVDLVTSGKRDVVLTLVGKLHGGGDPVELSEDFKKHLDELKDTIAARVKESFGDVDRREFTKEDRDRAKDEQTALVEAIFRHDIMEYLYLIEMWYRDVMVYAATGATEQLVNRDRLDQLARERAGQVQDKFKALDKARRYIERFLKEDRVFCDLFFSLAM